MDIIGDILDTVRLSGSLFFRANLGGHWGAYYQAIDAPVFHCILAGEAWVARQGHRDFVHCRAGDVVLFPHGDAHVIAHAPSAQGIPQARIDPAQSCQATQISDADASVRLLCGVFRVRSRLTHPLFQGLPGFLRMRPDGDHWLPHAAHALDTEAGGNAIDGVPLRDRLFEALFVQLLNAHWQGATHPGDGFAAAINDPGLRRALDAMHAQPQKAWTIDALAAVAHCSRSVFTAKFRRLLGQSPMEYLTHWRLQKAQALLRETALPVYAIASLVGYANVSSFIKACKREFGCTPLVLRRPDDAR